MPIETKPRGTWIDESLIDHDALLNWVANKHIDHSAVSITGAGLLVGQGGDITASRVFTLNNSDIDHNQLNNLAWSVAGHTMDADLAMSDNQISGIDNLLFTDVNGQIAGIENQNLLDKTDSESITGVYDFSGASSIRTSQLMDLPAATVFDVDADAGGFTGTIRFNSRGSLFSAYYFASTNGNYPFSFSLSNALAGFATSSGVPMAFNSASYITLNSQAGNPIILKSGDTTDYIELTTTANVPKIATVGNCNLEIDAPSANVVIPTSPLLLQTIKSGATQAAAGAVADELWKTNGHATLPDNVVMIGV